MTNTLQNQQFQLSAIQFIQKVVTTKSITLSPKEPWQPSIMLLGDFEKEWIACFNVPFRDFYREYVCKNPDPRYSISMRIMTCRSFVDDTRHKNKLFAEIPRDVLPQIELLIYFPKEYTIKALDVDLESHSQLQKSDKVDSVIKTLGRDLKEFLVKNYPDYYFNIIPFGSRCYGAYSNATDFNLCVVMDDPDLDCIVKSKLDSKGLHYMEPAESEHMVRLLGRHEKFKRATFDINYNTLRYVSDHGHVEFVFNKEIYTESELLIQQYINLDDRVGQLIAVIKNFTQLRNVTKGGLHGSGFYQYCVLVLAYLQQLDPPIIPNLQHLGFDNTDCCKVLECRTNRKYWDTALHSKKYVGAAAYYHTCVVKDKSKPETPYSVAPLESGGYYWNSSNTCTLSELTLDFFHHYGYEFKFNTLGISLKSGGIFNRGKNPLKDIYIEDPFLTGVNIADPNKITRGLSFFLGAFLIMYNDEICFSEALRYGGLLKIPEIKRLKTSKMPYQPLLKKRVAPASAICFVLIDLPKTTEWDRNCICEAIITAYKSLGHILHIETLDNTTKRVYLALQNNTDGRQLALPTPIKIKGRTVHVAKLYGFTLRT